jgi:methylenetetrahydrofolate reductase (NADPH)
MFFDNKFYFDFVDRCKSAGINVPIIPGIIPIVNFNQIQKFSEMCGASIPSGLADKMEEYKDDSKKKYQIGVDFAIDQCNELMKKGAPGIHFYTLNKSRATVDIFESIEK